jgi:pimeloyl-ACP methyl ester carboxylesterase
MKCFGPSSASTDRVSYLFILHGLFGNKKNWTSIVKKLTQFVTLKAHPAWHIIPLDLLNHGENIPHNLPPKLTLEDLAQDVIRQIQLTKPHGADAHILGHSLVSTIYLSIHSSIVGRKSCHDCGSRDEFSVKISDSC